VKHLVGFSRHIKQEFEPGDLKSINALAHQRLDLNWPAPTTSAAATADRQPIAHRLREGSNNETHDHQAIRRPGQTQDEH
jgi:hypothetical protein